VLVADTVKNCTAFLGFRTKDTQDADFIAVGTAFFFVRLSGQRPLLYAVTAKHVVDLVPKARAPMLRVNFKSGGVGYIALEKWHFHPQHNETGGRKRKYVDVAVHRTDFDWHMVDKTIVTEEDVLTPDKVAEFAIGTGDEVIVTGLFHSHYGESKNIPLIRVGNIAAMPSEPVPTDKGPAEAYLIELRSIGGISGSPVFTHLAVRPERTFVSTGKPVPDDGSFQTLKKAERYHFLLGMVQGYYTVTAPYEWVTKSELEAGDINTGIAVVLPAARITETIEAMAPTDDDTTRKLHEDSITKSGAHSAGWKPSSSDEAAPPATDANPNQREDFTSLLNAAARKPPQDDQT
jgi:hypothetical protein